MNPEWKITWPLRDEPLRNGVWINNPVDSENSILYMPIISDINKDKFVMKLVYFRLGELLELNCVSKL